MGNQISNEIEKYEKEYEARIEQPVNNNNITHYLLKKIGSAGYQKTRTASNYQSLWVDK